MEFSTQDWIDSLGSVLCPACGRKKRDRQTFCYACYNALPNAMRKELWRMVGDGYVEGVEAALKRLGVERPCLETGKVQSVTN